MELIKAFWNIYQNLLICPTPRLPCLSPFKFSLRSWCTGTLIVCISPRQLLRFFLEIFDVGWTQNVCRLSQLKCSSIGRYCTMYGNCLNSFFLCCMWYGLIFFQNLVLFRNLVFLICYLSFVFEILVVTISPKLYWTSVTILMVLLMQYSTVSEVTLSVIDCRVGRFVILTSVLPLDCLATTVTSRTTTTRLSMARFMMSRSHCSVSMQLTIHSHLLKVIVIRCCS